MMTVFAASNVVDNVVNSDVGRVAGQAVDAVTKQADVIANMLGVSSVIVLAVGLWLALKVGKKAVSAVLFVIAVILACIFFFGREPVYQAWSWFASMLGMA